MPTIPQHTSSSLYISISLPTQPSSVQTANALPPFHPCTQGKVATTDVTQKHFHPKAHLLLAMQPYPPTTILPKTATFLSLQPNPDRYRHGLSHSFPAFPAFLPSLLPRTQGKQPPLTLQTCTHMHTLPLHLNPSLNVNLLPGIPSQTSNLLQKPNRT